jgi:Uma2 family endonuclease
MIDPRPLPMSLDDYDGLQPPEGQIWELHEGYIVAFSTGTGRHAILCTRIAAELESHAAPPCHAFGASTIGVRQTDRATNAVPDGAVTCEELDLNETYIVAPKLVVEVISPESVNRDRVAKLDIYRAIPSLHEYLMIDSRKVWASLYRRGPANTWIDMMYTSLDDSIDLLSIESQLSIAHLYRGIDFAKKRKKRR